MNVNRFYQEAFSRLERCLLERMQAFRTPALVMALTDRDSSVRVSSFGLASLETKEPVRRDHLFPIGSVGKVFTAVAILRAREEGLLKLRAPVTDYLPWFEVQSPYEPITVHHLLTHTSGLPRGTDFSPDPRAEVYSLRTQSAGFAPGKHFSYSDVGYKILGLILEKVTGKSYGEVIREKILAPLQMENTYAVTTSSLRPCMASGYRYLYDDRPNHVGQPIVPATWLETNSGDGCIVSTAEDVARFARMILNEGEGPDGPVISKESYQKLVSPRIDEDGEAYGYGLYLFEDDGYQIAGHGGDVPGYQAYMWLDISNGIGSVVLMSEPYTPRASFLTLDYLRAAFLGHRLPDAPPLPDFTHIKDPAEYAGVYRGPKLTMILKAEGHHLVMACGEHEVILEDHGSDRFYANHPNWNLFFIQFGRSAAGQVIEAFYGPLWLTNEQYCGSEVFPASPEWEVFCGHYRSHNPWETNFRIFQRKGNLYYCGADGNEEVLVPLGGDTFRIGEDESIPERITFDQVVEGKALRALRSGCPYYRFFTP